MFDKIDCGKDSKYKFAVAARTKDARVCVQLTQCLVTREHIENPEIGGPANLAVQKSQINASEDWFCSFCSFKNNQFLKECEMCNSPKNGPSKVSKSPNPLLTGVFEEDIKVTRFIFFLCVCFRFFLTINTKALYTKIYRMRRMQITWAITGKQMFSSCSTETIGIW